MLRRITRKTTTTLLPFDGGVTGLSGWHNGIRDMEVFQPSFHGQRKGTRACSPLTGSSAEVSRKLTALCYLSGQKLETDETRE
jgi:hypothetical protein